MPTGGPGVPKSPRRGGYRGKPNTSPGAVIPSSLLGRPRKPRYLHRNAAAMFERLCDVLEEAGMLSVLDGDVLATYCCAVLDLAAARRSISREGIILKSNSGVARVNPAVAVQRDAIKAIRAASLMFGFDPYSRIHRTAGASPPPPAETDPLLKLLEETA